MSNMKVDIACLITIITKPKENTACN